MINLKYILPFLLLFCNVISQAQDDGYKIPSIDVEKATDSIVALLRKEKVDTIAEYQKYCGECYTSLYLKGTKKPYLVYRTDFNTESFIFWKKNKNFIAEELTVLLFTSLLMLKVLLFLLMLAKIGIGLKGINLTYMFQKTRILL